MSNWQGTVTRYYPHVLILILLVSWGIVLYTHYPSEPNEGKKAVGTAYVRDRVSQLSRYNLLTASLCLLGAVSVILSAIHHISKSSEIKKYRVCVVGVLTLMLAGILIASYRWKFQVRYHLVAQEHALAIWDGKNPKSFKILVDAMSPKDITFDDTAVPNLLPND